MATTEETRYFNNLLGNNFHKFSNDVLASINKYINSVGGTDEVNPNDVEFKIIRENNPFLVRNNNNANVSRNVELFFDDAHLARTLHLDDNCLIPNKFFDADPTDFLYRLRVMEGMSNSFSKYFSGQDKADTIKKVLKTEDGSSYKDAGYKEKSEDEDTIYGSVEQLGDGGGKGSDADTIRRFIKLIKSDDFSKQINDYRQKEMKQPAFTNSDQDKCMEFLFTELGRNDNSDALAKYNVLGYMDTLYDKCRNKKKLESDATKVFTTGRL